MNITCHTPVIDLDQCTIELDHGNWNAVQPWGLQGHTPLDKMFLYFFKIKCIILVEIILRLNTEIFPIQYSY